MTKTEKLLEEIYDTINYYINDDIKKYIVEPFMEKSRNWFYLDKNKLNQNLLRQLVLSQERKEFYIEETGCDFLAVIYRGKHYKEFLKGNRPMYMPFF